MKFKFVKEVSEPVNCYGLGLFKTGDIIEIESEWIQQKALNNPNYELADEKAKPSKPKPDPDYDSVKKVPIGKNEDKVMLFKWAIEGDETETLYKTKKDALAATLKTKAA